MSWSIVEDTRQLQEEYDRLLKQYEPLVDAFTQAQSKGDTRTATELAERLKQSYGQLEAVRRRLDRARAELAQQRDATAV
jgi:phage shock protein A